mmetsp:Transcript_51220/g.112260  ORF Transcript_51220/g.112260 Transcript_51220/m.112260 type:complete len:169 (+) Transcript_51220:69-575(+)
MTEPAEKKARTEGYALNVNAAVDKEWEAKSFREIAAAPVEAMQGIGPKGKEQLEKLKIMTVRDLADWKYFKVAQAIAILAPKETAGERHAETQLNINKAMDKAHETKSLTEILALPPSALQGLADWTDAALGELGITSISKLAEYKYAHWAQSICTLADYEAADFSHK